MADTLTNREDTKMKFSLTPGAETGFSQWLDAMKMVAQLPEGMPPEFRTKLWLQLSEKHLNDQNVDWEKAEPVIFNEWTNPDDEELGVQIVKDLHRTGCSLFCGEQEHNQALLKRVLLAYARWNKNVGYCQGFNMLAALILQVMDKDERNAVKVMIYLIEGVLPESYFANNLRGLSVDMAVFRDLLRLRLPRLSKHLEALQHDTNTGTSYEPPLTNVFTMQWFLTLFSNCLPQQTVLRVWDLVFLYGNEILLRTALAIWGILQDRVITVESADEFYSIMGVVTREMLEFGLMDANTLVKMIAMVDPFPNELQELRDKYLYNISPWTQSVQSAAKKGIRLFYSDPDDQDDTEDEDKIALATAYGVFRRRESTSRDLQVSGPTLDISVLKQQYAKLRERQRQAHVIITAACSSNLPDSLSSGPSVSVNHLLLGKSALVNKGRRIGPPEGSIPPPNNRKGDVRDAKKSKVVISGETYHWKDAEKRKVFKPQIRNKRNKREKIWENEKSQKENEVGKTNTNHDRMEKGVTEISVEDSLRKNTDRCGSSSSESSGSSSSTSTELCDEEIPRCSDLDSEEATNSDASGYLFENSPKLSESLKRVTLLTETLASKPETECRSNSKHGGCDKDNLTEIKTFAVTLVNEIEEKLQVSEKLKKLRHSDGSGETVNWKHPPEVTVNQFDNTTNLISPLDENFQCDNILKPEPEVPINENVIEENFGWEKGATTRTPEAESGKREEEVTKKDKIRRKSDLGLSIMKENLEILHKFSQKIEKTGSGSFEVETRGGVAEVKKDKMKSSVSSIGEWSGRRNEKTKEDGESEEDRINYSLHPEQEEHSFSKTEPEKSTGMRNSLVEKAISPIVPEKMIKPAVKVNKEVNTEITFGVDEVDISTSKANQRKLIKTERFRGEDESPFGERDGNEMKTRIEVSKSDWELKMRKIAELETTTRETLNEIHAQSMHRKSVHQSLDRTTRRTYFEENSDREKLNSVGSSFFPKIEMLDVSNEVSSDRKSRISTLSFDAITSRTEKLLGKMEFNRSTDDNLYGGPRSPEMEFCRKPDDSTSKFKKLIEESYGGETGIEETEARAFRSKPYEYYSSPTSPEFRPGSRVKYSEYSSPKKYQKSGGKPKLFDEEDLLRVTQNESKTSVDLVKKKYPHMKPEVEGRTEVPDLESLPNRLNFNPFPTRTQSRPKELGVKLGLYPTSPEGNHKKS